MIEIEIHVCGDHWMNPEKVEQKLQVLPANTQIMINMRSEGGSLQALGIQAMLDQYLQPEIQFWRLSFCQLELPIH